MEEEYRIVNGLKLPPKRHIVVKRKDPSSSSVTGTPPHTSIRGDQGLTSSEAHSDQKNEMDSSLPFGAIQTVSVELKKKSKCEDIVLPEQPESQKNGSHAAGPQKLQKISIASLQIESAQTQKLPKISIASLQSESVNDSVSEEPSMPISQGMPNPKFEENPKWWSWRGRMGRAGKEEFLKGILVSDFVIFLLVGIAHDNPFLACLLSALIYGCTVPLRVRRLHDRGMSARWLLAFLAPLVFGLLTFLLWRTNGLSVLWGTFLLTEVLQFVTYGCFNGAWESNQFGPDPLWVNVCKELNVPLVQSEASLQLGSIMAVVLYFKRRYKCDAIVLPGQPKFEEKWHALVQSIHKLTGERPIRGHVLALIDCTALGGCEEGALIDKSGIYMVSGDKELDGWLDWQSFVEKANIGRSGFGKIRICSSPNVGLHVLGSLSVVKAIKLFGAILDKASGGKTKPSQVQVVSRHDRVKDFVMYSVLTIVCLAPLGAGYWGVKCYAHVQNVEKAFSMMCERQLSGFKGVVSVDVPMWNRFGSNKYQCAAKIKVAKEGKSEETLDVTFVARRVSSVDVIKDVAYGAGALKALNDGKVDKAVDRMAQIDDDWDVNMGFWGWIGDDYHIGDVEVK